MIRQAIPILLWSVPLLLLAVGVALTAIGLRGRKLDDHPICRACRYDLVGNPDAAVCPECGVDLHRPKATALGHRQRRRKPLVLGLVCLTPAVVVFAGLGIVTARDIDIDRHKPIWLLMREGDAQSLAELNRRLAAGELTDQQVQQIIVEALAVQADRARRWVPGWGDFVEKSRGMKLASDTQWEAYAKQAMEFKLDVRPRVRRGDPVVLRITPAIARAAAQSVLSLNWQIGSVWLADVPHVRLVPPGEFSTPTSMFGGGTQSRTDRFVPDASINNLPNAPHPLRVDLVVLARATFVPAQSIVYRHKLKATVALVARDEPVVRTLHDPSLRPGIDEAMEPYTMISVGADGAVNLELAADRPPIGLAFDVLLRDDRGREWRFGRASFPVGTHTPWTSQKRLAGFDADEVEVVLRSSEPVAAAETVDVAEIWGGEIIFPDVPVAWASGVPRPTTTKAAR